MAAQPLSHHEILALVEPFTRRGRRVDLAASDRLARRLAFAPVEHETPALHESLALEHPGPGELRLTRTLRDANGVPAALVCDAGDAAEALAAEEMWLSSSTKEVLAITTLDGKPFGGGRPGPVFRRIWEIFQQRKPKAH